MSVEVVGRKQTIMWLKKQAIQIAAQLPEDVDQAMAVLDLTRKILDGFLRDDSDQGRGDSMRVAAVLVIPTRPSGIV